MGALGEHIHELQGMLVERGEQPVFMYEETGTEQAVALKAFLKILESGEWLAKFFVPVLIEEYAKQMPTPLEMMKHLAEPALNFEADIDDARRMIHNWPQFFPGQMATAEPRKANGTAGAARPSR